MVRFSVSPFLRPLSPSVFLLSCIGRSASCHSLIIVWSRTICIVPPLRPCWDTPSSETWLMRDKFASCSKTTLTEPGRRGRKVSRNECNNYTINRCSVLMNSLKNAVCYYSFRFSFIKTKLGTGTRVFSSRISFIQTSQHQRTGIDYSESVIFQVWYLQLNYSGDTFM